MLCQRHIGIAFTTLLIEFEEIITFLKPLLTKQQNLPWVSHISNDHFFLTKHNVKTDGINFVHLPESFCWYIWLQQIRLQLTANETGIAVMNLTVWPHIPVIQTFYKSLSFSRCERILDNKLMLYFTFLCLFM